MEAHQFLTIAANNSDITFVVEDFFQGAAVANEVEVGTPKVATQLLDGPASSGDFSDERVPSTLRIGTALGPETGRAEASTIKGKVKLADTSFEELLRSGTGSGSVLRLAKDETEAIGTPIGLQEGR